MEVLWQNVISSLCYVHRDYSLFQHFASREELIESLQQVQNLLYTSDCLLPSETDISNLPLSMTTEEICLKVISLSIYIQFYLDHLLSRATYNANPEESNRVTDGLYSILDRIIRLVAHLSPIGDYIYHAYNFGLDNHTGATNAFLHFPDVQPHGLKGVGDAEERDTALALVYAFARLLKNMLEGTANESEKCITEIHKSAIAICRLCASFPDRSPMVTLLAKRSLFWAGLILTESRLNAAHSWISRELQQCILSGIHWHHIQIIQDEAELISEMLRKADRCTSIRDIWGIAVGEVSLFSYTATLPTWFFDLNLVRFQHTPTGGKKLVII